MTAYYGDAAEVTLNIIPVVAIVNTQDLVLVPRI